MLFFAFLRRQIIAEIDQIFYLFLRHGAVQTDGEPLFLVHMICRVEALPRPQKAAHGGIAFHVQDVHRAAAGKAQPVPPDFHHQSVPLSAIRMAQDGVWVRPGIVRVCAVFCFYIGEDILSGHGVRAPVGWGRGVRFSVSPFYLVAFIYILFLII